jgi:hypothetical protein
MKIPLSIKIGAHTVSVEMPDSNEEIGDKTGEDLGDTLLAQNRIRVCAKYDGDDVPESMMAEVFLHEILHYVLYQAGHGLCEQEVTAAASGLLQVIRDNNLDFRKGAK